MEEDILNNSQILMFRGTPCTYNLYSRKRLGWRKGGGGYKQSYKNCEFATKSSKIFLKSQVVLGFMFERLGPYE